MQIKRALRHLFCLHFRVKKFFPAKGMQAIEAAIHEMENTHAGEIVFAVEANLNLPQLLHGLTPRQRALQVFSNLRVWDTEDNNGVLLYLLLADKDIEIVADRGVSNRVAPGEWQRICQEIESHFKCDNFEAGVLAGLRLIAEHLAKHYPGQKGHLDELPDKPVVL